MIDSSGFMQTLAWSLLHFLWQGAAIAAAAALGLRLLRRGSPQARYVLACAALAAMLASPAVTAARLLSPTPPAVAPVQRTLFLRVLPQGATRVRCCGSSASVAGRWRRGRRRQGPVTRRRGAAHS